VPRDQARNAVTVPHASATATISAAQSPSSASRPMNDCKISIPPPAAIKATGTQVPHRANGPSPRPGRHTAANSNNNDVTKYASPCCTLSMSRNRCRSGGGDTNDHHNVKNAHTNAAAQSTASIQTSRERRDDDTLRRYQ